MELALRAFALARPWGARGVHSRRVVNKMNFIRRRKEGRLGEKVDRNKELRARVRTADLSWNKPAVEVEPLRNGWTKPPDQVPSNLPFVVFRSSQGWLPVYIKKSNMKERTRIRHVQGDLDSFKAGLLQLTPDHKIVQKQGTVDIAGDHVAEVRQWLAGLGF